MFQEFKSSVLQSGQGPLTEFQGSLIREKLKAKQIELDKKRANLRQSEEAKERNTRLKDPDVTNRALAKVHTMTMFRKRKSFLT
jgi:hypothetical protein